MGLSLTLERVRELAREYALIPLCLDVIADLERALAGVAAGATRK